MPFLIGNSLSLLGPATDALHLHSTTTNREKARRGEPAGQCGCPEERYRTVTKMPAVKLLNSLLLRLGAPAW